MESRKKDIVLTVLKTVLKTALWIVVVILSPFKRDITVAKVRGIPVILTAGFLNFIGIISVIGLFAWGPEIARGEEGAIVKALPIRLLIAYFCVVLHEFGHSFTGQFFGYNVPSIKLVPFSGLATIEGDWHKNWRHEFYITVFGPMVNAVLMLLTWPFLGLDNVWIQWFFDINMILLLFNLIPCFPMDGGRIVRSLLTRFSGGDWWRSTVWTHYVGMTTAVVAAPLLWMYWNPIAAILIAVMAFIFGSAERSHLKEKHLKEEYDDLLQNQKRDAEAAISKAVQDQFPDDPDKAEEMRQQLLTTHEFMERIGMALIKRMTKEAKNKKEEFDKTKFKIKLSFVTKELIALSVAERAVFNELWKSIQSNVINGQHSQRDDEENAKIAFVHVILNQLETKIAMKGLE